MQEGAQLYAQGKYAEAELLVRRALAIGEAALWDCRRWNSPGHLRPDNELQTVAALYLLRLPQMPALMSRNDPEAGIEVVSQPPVKGGRDPQAPQIDAVSSAKTIHKLSLQAIEFREQLLSRACGRGDEWGGRLDTHAHRRLGGPAQKPSDKIAPVARAGRSFRLPPALHCIPNQR